MTAAQTAAYSGLTASTRPRPRLAPPGLSGVIIDEAAREADISPADILGPRRFPYFVAARALVAQQLRAHGYSYTRIGRLLGSRHHTTVMNLLRPRKLVPALQPYDPTAPDTSGEWAI